MQAFQHKVKDSKRNTTPRNPNGSGIRTSDCGSSLDVYTVPALRQYKPWSISPSFVSSALTTTRPRGASLYYLSNRSYPRKRRSYYSYFLRKDSILCFLQSVTPASTRPLFDYTSAGSSGKPQSKPNAAQVDVSSFKNDGFRDFTLDLSCLSNPSSPVSSPPTPLTSENGINVLPAPSPSSPLLPQMEESPRSSPVPPETPSPKASSITRAASMMRMSLPAMKYIGRGTPIDPGRRSQWGGRKSEDVTEDGMLFSEPRAHSLDSHNYPRRHRRSISSEWQAISGPRALSPLHMDIDSSLENHTPSFLEPLPESSKIQIQVDSDPTEWESVMKTVLGSSGITSSSRPHSGDGETSSSRRSSQGPVPGLPQHPNGFDIVLGLNSALDLGLGLGKGMNFFDLGLIPDTGRDTPSVYSLAPESPDHSRPPSTKKLSRELDHPEDTPEHKPTPEQEQKESQQQEQHSSEDGGSGGTSAETRAPAVIPFEPKAMRDVHRMPWWQKAVLRFRKVQKFIKAPSRM
ncbi:hypothetical protein J3R30DRAFT_2958125 [Lentinula aciculospora]|uniref:Uncharacterized protein n=1 Tax=Lentinula aciculospora TaxID=153920 RepID=A0A9W8ZRP5_9AGAR|nr:hypothetical protein J3R30DRAFT_2958125 [Lentinula aciculospora]